MAKRPVPAKKNLEERYFLTLGVHGNCTLGFSLRLKFSFYAGGLTLMIQYALTRRKRAAGKRSNVTSDDEKMAMMEKVYSSAEQFVDEIAKPLGSVGSDNRRHRREVHQSALRARLRTVRTQRLLSSRFPRGRDSFLCWGFLTFPF